MHLKKIINCLISKNCNTCADQNDILAKAAVSLQAVFNGFLKTTEQHNWEEEQSCSRAASKILFISNNANRKKAKLHLVLFFKSFKLTLAGSFDENEVLDEGREDR